MFYLEIYWKGSAASVSKRFDTWQEAKEWYKAIKPDKVVVYKKVDAFWDIEWTPEGKYSCKRDSEQVKEKVNPVADLNQFLSSEKVEADPNLPQLISEVTKAKKAKPEGHGFVADGELTGEAPPDLVEEAK